jgi:drug/metabolite transporter (DMT)-like permease
MGLNGILYYGPILMVIVSTLLYHIAQKSLPTNMNPIVTLLVTYSSSLVLCIAAFPLFKLETSLVSEIKKANWGTFALGLAVLGIEIGFLYAYRAGWNVSKANLTASSIVVILLIVVGVLMYHEKISFINLIGVVLCMVGVGLLSR